jgi:hypothetical protein
MDDVNEDVDQGETSDATESADEGSTVDLPSETAESPGGDRTRPSRPLKRPISEIIGLSRKDAKLFVIVKYGDTDTPQAISIGQAHRHYLRELIEFYERHLVFSPPFRPA